MDLKTTKHIRERVHDNISKSENYYKPNEYIVLNRCEILFFVSSALYIYSKKWGVNIRNISI